MKSYPFDSTHSEREQPDLGLEVRGARLVEHLAKYERQFVAGEVQRIDVDAAFLVTVYGTLTVGLVLFEKRKAGVVGSVTSQSLSRELGTLAGTRSAPAVDCDERWASSVTRSGV